MNIRVLLRKQRKIIQGFTLIELLVVISIIGILASLVLVSFIGVQKQARDAERKSDLKQYQTALEFFANKNDGFYSCRTGNSVSASRTLCGDLGITTCPEDPKYTDGSDGFEYKYQSDGTSDGSITATKYILWDKLERKTDYWVICSGGKSGLVADPLGGVHTPGDCPL